MNRLLPLVALAAAPLVANAQSKPAAKCDWKPTDAWVKRQAEFFDDSKHDWSDDTLRTALLQAAGLGASLTAPVQFGVQIEGREPALGAGAAAMTERLKALAAQRGSKWPTRSVVGAAGVHAVVSALAERHRPRAQRAAPNDGGRSGRVSRRRRRDVRRPPASRLGTKADLRHSIPRRCRRKSRAVADGRLGARGSPARGCRVAAFPSGDLSGREVSDAPIAFLPSAPGRCLRSR